MKDDLLSCPSKDALVTFLYDEDDGEVRAEVERHLQQCPACREEVAGLRQVRGHLAEWHAPELATHARIVVEPVNERPRPWVTRPWFVGAAAALLVMGVAAGLANLEVRYDSGGFVLRTGWARTAQVPVTAARDEGASRSEARPAAAAPWRNDLVALERQLRQDFVAGRDQGGAPVAVRPVSSLAGTRLDPDVLRQIQALIDESEVRQQRNLALRVAELSRDFDLQRRADLVEIKQGLGQLEGRTEAEVARNREMMNYIMRVSQQPPR
jgi:anti-sigma factor RsiW